MDRGGSETSQRKTTPRATPSRRAAIQHSASTGRLTASHRDGTQATAQERRSRREAPEADKLPRDARTQAQTLTSPQEPPHSPRECTKQAITKAPIEGQITPANGHIQPSQKVHLLGQPWI